MNFSSIPDATVNIIGSDDTTSPNLSINPTNGFVYFQKGSATAYARSSTMGVSYPLTVNTWYHIGLYIDESSPVFFMNGVTSGPSSTYYYGVNWSPSPTLKFSFIGKYFPGNIDEVAIWTDTDMSGEMGNIYNGVVANNLTTYNPDHWWRMGDFEGGTGNTVADQSGGNNATMNGCSFDNSIAP